MKEVVRKRILEDCIRQARRKSGDGWLVLVLDKRTTRIVSSCCRMYDITSEGVTLVENLHIKRQPLPAMDAVYIVEPTDRSVGEVCDDFKTSPTYQNAHVFCTAPLPESCMELIKRSTLRKHILTLQEINIDFLVPEAQTVHLDTPSPLSMFSHTNPSARFLQEHTIKGIVSIALTLGELPAIRYDTQGVLAKSIAMGVDRALADVVRSKPSLLKTPNEPPVLLVVDRSHDVLAPLLHEFTYQAMVNDVVPLDGEVYSFKSGGQEKKMALNESDVLWPTLRHMHISDCITWLLESFNNFTQQNKVAKLRNGVSSLSDMSAAIKAMPQYRELIEKYELHIDLAGHCMRTFNETMLERIGGLEQDMAEAKSKDDKLYTRLITLLRSDISLLNKKRLLMVYMVTQGVAADKRAKLCELAGLEDGDDQTALLKLFELGANLQEERKGMLSGLGRKKAKKRQDDVDFELSRFRPKLHTTLEELLQDKLATKQFPFTKEGQGSSGGGGGAGGEVGTSHRSKGAGKVTPTWQFSRQAKKEEASGPTGPRVIVFVVGGMTHSELRVGYSLADAHKREVVMCSNVILTPKSFVRGLELMDAPVAEDM